MTKPTKRKKPATAGRKSKPWRNAARLELLPLEHAVAKLLLMRTPEPAIMDWVKAQDGYAGVSAAQVDGLILGIRERWRAAQDHPAAVATARAEQAAMLDAAIHDAWFRPVFNPETGEPLKNPDGTAVARADHKALAAYLKLRAEFYGLKAPEKHIHLVGQAPPPRALSPAERQAEIQELLERRKQAMLGSGAIDTTAVDRMIEKKRTPA